MRKLINMNIYLADAAKFLPSNSTQTQFPQIYNTVPSKVHSQIIIFSKNI